MTLTVATLTALLVPATILVAFFVLAGRQIAALYHQSETIPAWTAELSVERYRPMFRLLSEDDIRFLRSQPGATDAMVNRLRKQRCELFRGYLRSLESDFRRTSEALILVMVQSQSDRKDLIGVLIGSKAKFKKAMFAVRCSLFLYRWNIGQEPVFRLVEVLEGLHRQLRASEPATGDVRG